MKHIVHEHFREVLRKQPRPSRLWELLTSGKVLSCAKCGAFTQTSKKIQPRTEIPFEQRKPVSSGDKCHKCQGPLFDLRKYAEYADVESYWIYMEHREHVPVKGEYYCEYDPIKCRKSLLQWSLDEPPGKFQAKVAKTLSAHLGKDIQKFPTHCAYCGGVQSTWQLNSEGSLRQCIKDGRMLTRWLAGGQDIEIIMFDKRAEIEGVAVETIATKTTKSKKKKAAPAAVYAPQAQQRRPQQVILPNRAIVDNNDLRRMWQQIRVNAIANPIDFGVDVVELIPAENEE